MTTTESKLNFERLIFRLERNHRCVLRLAKNLNSYKYEPKNYECFARLSELKAAFSVLAKKQMALFDQIQHHSLPFGDATEKVEDSIKQYHGLEKKMAEYLLGL
ncbi:MAG: hypothetical protein AAGC45_04605 [Bacteroidota bacterium]